MKMLIFPFFAFWLLIIYGCSKSDEQFNPETEHYNIENKLISGTGATSFQRVIAGNSGEQGGRNSIHLNSVKQTPDLGYIFCGGIRLYDKPGVIVIKTNNRGETEWLDTISDEFGVNYSDITITEDGGFIIAGAISTEEGNWGDATSSVGMLTHFNNNGQKVWEKSFGIRNGKGYLRKVLTTGDGGFLMVGSWHPGIDSISSILNETFLIKTNENGEEIWRKSYSNFGSIEDIENTNDGGFIICSSNESGGNVSKINNKGEEVWLNKVNNGIVNNIKVLQDGYVVSGIDDITKLDSSGNWAWSQNYDVKLFEESGYPTHYGTYYEIMDITLTDDNNFVVIGGYDGYHFDKDIGFSRSHLIKISSENGEIMWVKPFNPEEDNRLLEIQRCADNGFIIAGTTADFDNEAGSNAPRWGYIIKTDENGN